MSDEKEKDGRESMEAELADFPGIVSVTGRVLKHVSASQITSFRKCNRKWHWNKVEGVVSPESPSQRLGKQVHARIEKYLKTGEVPRGDEASRIALSGLPFLPAPGTPDMFIEHPLKMRGPHLKLAIIGYIDLWLRRQRKVTDHKTTSDFKWVKSAEELRNDTQAIIYGKEALDKAREDDNEGIVEFEHVAYLTKGTIGKATTSGCKFSPAELEDKFAKIVLTIDEMAQCALVPVKDVACNTAACREYRGCEFFSNCQNIRPTTIWPSLNVKPAPVSRGLSSLSLNTYKLVDIPVEPVTEEKQMAKDPSMANFYAQARKAMQKTAPVLTPAKPAPAVTPVPTTTPVETQPVIEMVPNPEKQNILAKIAELQAQALVAMQAQDFRKVAVLTTEANELSEQTIKMPDKIVTSRQTPVTPVVTKSFPQVVKEPEDPAGVDYAAVQEASAQEVEPAPEPVKAPVAPTAPAAAPVAPAATPVVVTAAHVEKPVEGVQQLLPVTLIPGINPPDGTPMDVIGELEEKKGRGVKVLLPDGRAISALKKPELTEAHVKLVSGLSSADRELYLSCTTDECRIWVGRAFTYKGKKPKVPELRADLVMLSNFILTGEMVERETEVGDDEDEALAESDKPIPPVRVAEAEQTESEGVPLPGLPNLTTHNPVVQGTHLYINCSPRYLPTVHLDKLMEPFLEAIARAAGVEHHFLIKGFNEGAKRAGALLLAHVRSGQIKLPQHIIVDRRSPSADSIIEAIAPLFDNIIEKF